MTDFLLGIVIVLILVVIVLLFWTRRQVNSNDLSKAITDAWNTSSLSEIKTYAKDIRDDYRRLDEMLRVPKERANLGEIALEQILTDQLPLEMFGIRKSVLGGKNPDAHIVSTIGIICIDSKFPLDNYRKMFEPDNQGDKTKFQKDFIKDVEGHLKKIATDYVVPDKGSAEFAFAYIPSESVYYFLVTNAYDLLREYTKKGVQVISPLTLSHKIELIKAGVHARRLSEQAEKVHDEIKRLERAFRDLDGKWKTFFGHFTNAQNQAVGDLDKAYRKLSKEFDDTAKGINSSE